MRCRPRWSKVDGVGFGELPSPKVSRIDSAESPATQACATYRSGHYCVVRPSTLGGLIKEDAVQSVAALVL